MKQVVIATVLSFLAMYLLGGLYAGLLVPTVIGGGLDPAILRMPTNHVLVLLGYMLAALILSLLYPRFVPSTKSPAWHGLRFGALVGAVMGIPYTLVFYGAYNLPYAMLVTGLVWPLTEQGLGGVVVALVYARSQPRYSALQKA